MSDMHNLIQSIISATSASVNNVTNVVGDIWFVKTENDGWLGFKLDSDERINICDYTKLTYLKEENERVHFKIKDKSSEYNNKTCNITKVAFPKYFTKDPIIKEDITLKLKYVGSSEGILTVNGKTYTATLTSSNRIRVGTHKVMRPDAAHRGGANYRVAGSKVWFPLHVAAEMGITRGRYLHVGLASAGCISVTDVDKWVEIYNYLIKYRSTSDDKVVCEVKVEA